MNNPTTLDNLGAIANAARRALIAAIEQAQIADKALKAETERIRQTLPEYAAYKAARSQVEATRNEYDKAYAAFKTEQAIAS